MSGNFVRERQRIVYIYNVYYICKQYVAARARNFQTFFGPSMEVVDVITH